MNAQLADAAREVVMRARAGDQVAIAHIARVRDGAKAGNPVLKESEKAIEQFIAKHPARDTTARWGAEVSVNTNPKAQQALWKARASSPEVFAIIVAKTAPFVRLWDLMVAMLHGPLLTQDAPLSKTVTLQGSRIGSCARNARQLQMIATNPKVPISTYCRVTGWELGE
jgi:hypothetical protein